MTTKYIQLSFNVSTQQKELLYLLFLDLNSLGQVEEPLDKPISLLNNNTEQALEKICGFFEITIPVDEAVEQLKRNIEAWFLERKLTSPSYTVEILRKENWQQDWQQHFEPLEIGRRFLVVAPWSEITTHPKRKVLRIFPGQAFGTGRHETTQHCIRLLETYMKPQSQVLDVGCGSGILGLAALKLGAAEVLAIDNDADAIREALQNAKDNAVEDRFLALVFDLEQLADVQADVVIANLLAEIILEHQMTLLSCCKESGLLVLSGIVNTQALKVKDAFQRHGCRTIVEKTGDEFTSLLVYRKGQSSCQEPLLSS